MNLQKYLPQLINATKLLRFNTEIVDCLLDFWNYPKLENTTDTICHICLKRVLFYEKFSIKCPTKSEAETKKILLKDMLYAVAIYFSHNESIEKNNEFLEIARYMDSQMGEILSDSDFDSLLDFKKRATTRHRKYRKLS